VCQFTCTYTLVAVLFPETRWVSAANTTTTCLSCAAWVACNSKWRWWLSLRLRELPSVYFCDVLCKLRSDHLSNRHWCRGWLDSRLGAGARCRWRHSCSQKLLFSAGGTVSGVNAFTVLALVTLVDGGVMLNSVECGIYYPELSQLDFALEPSTVHLFIFLLFLF